MHWCRGGAARFSTQGSPQRAGDNPEVEVGDGHSQRQADRPMGFATGEGGKPQQPPRNLALTQVEC